METISSGTTFLMKRVFPVMWFGIIIVSVVATAAADRGFSHPELVLIPLVMLVVGAALFRKLLGNLADEVRDGGDVLVVRRGQLEERVSLSNVMNVSMSQFTNPPRLTLRLRTPGKLGDEISFIPRSPLFRNPFARNPVAEALIARVDRVRTQAGPGR